GPAARPDPRGGRLRPLHADDAELDRPDRAPLRPRLPGLDLLGVQKAGPDRRRSVAGAGFLAGGGGLADAVVAEVQVAVERHLEGFQDLQVAQDGPVGADEARAVLGAVVQPGVLALDRKSD